MKLHQLLRLKMCCSYLGGLLRKACAKIDRYSPRLISKSGDEVPGREIPFGGHNVSREVINQGVYVPGRTVW